MNIDHVSFVNVEPFISRGIMMYGDTSRRGTPFAKDPAVIRFDGRYLLYYSIPGIEDTAGWCIGIASSTDMIYWQKCGELKKEQECKAKGFCAPGAIVLGNRIHLFYQTYGNGRNDAICHAWSDDGLRFTRNPANPIFHPTGDWNCGRAIDADVIEHNGHLLLYFASRDPEFRIQLQGVAWAPIDSDFSRSCWTQLGEGSILKPELPWELNCIEAAALCRHNGKLYMFYGGGYNNEPQQIGCAVSSDGVVWKRVSDQPVIPNGKPGDWNASESGHPFAFRDDDGRTYIFYQGNNDNGKSWYLSKVEIKWENEHPYPLRVPER